MFVPERLKKKGHGFINRKGKDQIFGRSRQRRRDENGEWGRRSTWEGFLASRDFSVHLNKLLADGGVGGDLAPQDLYLFIRHHLPTKRCILHRSYTNFDQGSKGSKILSPLLPVFSDAKEEEKKDDGNQETSQWKGDFEVIVSICRPLGYYI